MQSSSKSADPSSAWVLLPLKDFHNAKQRLAGVLQAEARKGFFKAMAEDVLRAITAARAPAGVLVVTRDAEARALAVRYGAEVLAETDNEGQTSAVNRGARSLAERGVGTMIAVPGDVPLVTADEIDAILRVHREGTAVTIAPAHDERGSNAVVCSPPEILPFRFGNDSFVPHLAAARALGIEPVVIKLPGIALDIDHPEDLAKFAQARSDTLANIFIREHNLHPL